MILNNFRCLKTGEAEYPSQLNTGNKCKQVTDRGGKKQTIIFFEINHFPRLFK
jgi:hypothetical protein